MSEPKEVEIDLATATELVLDARDKLHRSLLKIGEMKSANDPDWKPAVLDVFSKYCQEIGFGLEAIHPIVRLHQELAERIYKDRGEIASNSLAIKRFLALNMAAAMVTVLHKRGAYASITLAAEAVAKASGIDQPIIESHRQTIQRGNRSSGDTDNYNKVLTQIADWSNEDLLKSATFLHQFVN